jgi:hypothetical protein
MVYFIKNTRYYTIATLSAQGLEGRKSQLPDRLSLVEKITLREDNWTSL